MWGVVGCGVWCSQRGGMGQLWGMGVSGQMDRMCRRQGTTAAQCVQVEAQAERRRRACSREVVVSRFCHCASASGSRCGGRNCE